ncbi:MAG: tetratricopeptide repeat protein [Myxococcota bacterium]
MNRNFLIISAIFLSAFFARVILAAIYADNYILNALLVDHSYYDNWGMRIVSGEIIGDKPFEMDPLYAYLLALIYSVLGHNLFAVRVIQAIIGGIVASLVYLIARRVLKKEEGDEIHYPALLAALLCAFSGILIYYDLLIMKTSLAAFFFTLFIHLFLIAMEMWGKYPFLAGIVLGLLSLTRANAFILFPLALFFLFKERLVSEHLLSGNFSLKQFAAISKPKLKSAAFPALTFLAGLFIVLLFPISHNLAATGEFVLLSTGGGEVFYIGNNPRADGQYILLDFVHPNPEEEHEDFRKEARQRTGQNLTNSEASRYWWKQGLNFILSSPDKWLYLMLRKIATIINAYEYPDSTSYYFYVANLSLLSLFAWLNASLIFPLAILGFIFYKPTEKRNRLHTIGAFILLYVFGILIFFVFSRFRVPLYPVLCVAAAGGIFALKSALKKGFSKDKSYKTPIMIASFILAVAAVNYPPKTDIELDTAIQYENLGGYAFIKGDIERAVEFYSQALARRPTQKSLFGMGIIAYGGGNFETAAKFLSQAIEKGAGVNALKFCLASYLKLGEFEKANDTALQYVKRNNLPLETAQKILSEVQNELAR